MQKKEEKRPTIDDIIMSDIFQSKCRLMRITLPLNINKKKLAHMETKELAFAAKKVVPVIVKAVDDILKCCSKHTEFMKTCK